MSRRRILWTEYMKYRARLRGYRLERLEEILRYSTERYFDTVTGRLVVVGNYEGKLVLIPYEQRGDVIIPITVHAITRKQIKFRLKSGRFVHE